MTQRKLYMLLAVNVVWAYTLLCAAFWASDKVIVACAVGVIAVWWASPLLMFWARSEWESFDKQMPLFDLKRGSWAFQLGDTIVLPLAVIFAVIGRNRSDVGAWADSLVWFLVCLLVGLMAGVVFRWLDGGNYRKVGAAAALRSPSKWVHDFVAYPVIFGGLLYGGLPLLIHGSPWAMPVIACIVVWIFLGLRDLIYELDPKDLHPDWNEQTFTAQAWTYEQAARANLR